MPITSTPSTGNEGGGCNVLSFNGPKVADEMYKYATLKGALGDAADAVQNMGTHLVNHGSESESFPLGGESRADKFVNTLLTFGKGGACAGALVANTAMIPYDFIVGKGKLRKEGEDFSVFDQGALGEFGSVMTKGLGLTSEIGAMLTGVGVSLVDAPASMMTNKSFSEWISSHASGFGKAVSTGVATAASFAVGAALDVARVASLVVKYTFSGVVALGSLVAGLVAGSIRAIINK